MKLDYGKYRGIIVSVALFLLLDASVLMMNFYISFEISEDAVGVNLAGRQRMLSQRMMKSLLDIEAAKTEADQQRAAAELASTVALFDTTFNAFSQGGRVKGADGSDVVLAAATSSVSRSALQEAEQIWLPFKQTLKPLLEKPPQPSSLEYAALLAPAVDYGRGNNLQLLKLMNDLTVDLESVAASKAKRLRLIQTIGITLAVINFFIIMFHFLRQLRESDEKIEAARKETEEILETVNEGLFLLDPDQRIGSQHSAAMSQIFGSDHIAGRNFENLLSGIVADRDLNTASSFIRLLFDPRKKQRLIGDLNPLRQVEVHIPRPDGSYENKHLSFAFSRVEQGGEIRHVLVTVLDITQQVKLADELENARVQGEEQLELLSTIVQSNSELLTLFLKNSFKTFTKINNLLKLPARHHEHYLNKANQIFALVHNYKGEASALELSRFSRQAHEFEERLNDLRSRSELGGNDFLGLAVHLNKLIAQTETIAGLVDKLTGLKINIGEHAPEKVSGRSQHLYQLSKQLAERQGKEIELLCSGFDELELDEALAASINSITVQLLRNAVSHGIETPDARELSQKNRRGEVDVRLLRRLDGSLQLTVEDDGAGLDRDAIIQRGIEQGLVDEVEAESLDSKAIINLIFHPELSTRDEADEDAGRGVGMFAIRQAVRDIGGKISIRTRRGQGSCFQVQIPGRAAIDAATAA